MPDEHKNIGEEYQRLGKDGFDAIVRSFAEMNKGFQAIGAEMTSYSKKAFDEGMHTWEQPWCEVHRRGGRNPVSVRQESV
ncbi:MAG: hypothetical protein ACM3MH_05295 [Actinomycetota bacterium]